MAETEHSLVERAQKGEQAAFEELVRRYQGKAYGIAVGMLHDSEAASDVVQDAFLKAYRHLGRFQGGSSFYTWFYRIVVNLSIDHIRRRKRSARIEYDDGIARPELGEQKGTDLAPRYMDSNPAKAYQRRRLAQEIARCVDALSPKHRAVIVLREYEGLSYNEIAEVLGIAKGTVMSRLFHARKRLQEMLGEYLGGDDLTI